MRATRNDTVILPIPMARTLQYPSDGYVPFGMPAPLNPEIMEGAVHHQPRVVMQTNAVVGRPWQLQEFSLTQNALVGYGKTTWCVSCGFQKAASYGYRCKQEYCAQCGWLKEHHSQSNCLMGPCCMNPVKFDSPHTQWYVMEKTQVGIT